MKKGVKKGKYSCMNNDIKRAPILCLRLNSKASFCINCDTKDALNKTDASNSVMATIRVSTVMVQRGFCSSYTRFSNCQVEPISYFWLMLFTLCCMTDLSNRPVSFLTIMTSLPVNVTLGSKTTGVGLLSGPWYLMSSTTPMT